MGFGVELSSLRVKPFAQRPLTLFKAERAETPGVGVVINHSEIQRAFFYPQSLIEEHVSRLGGRDKYVYHEGFDPERSAKSIAPLVQSEAPLWFPRLQSATELPLSDLLISQPGVNVWRMLCFALDHGITETDTTAPGRFVADAPPSLVLNFPTFGSVLQAGNHRALFLLGSGIDTINAHSLVMPFRAFSFLANLTRNVDHVESSFGSRGVLALAESFRRQVEVLEVS